MALCVSCNQMSGADEIKNKTQYSITENPYKKSRPFHYQQAIKELRITQPHLKDGLKMLL